jgi:adenine phosphoribosyltransferase
MARNIVDPAIDLGARPANHSRSTPEGRMSAVLREKIRAVPDFPKKGILFRDITPLLGDARMFKQMVDVFVDRYRAQKPDKIVAIESRGYLIGAPLAYALGAGLVIVRKPGKLPHTVDRESYALEYGTDALEIHVDALAPGERAIVVDDLLATGGTAAAAARMVQDNGGVVVGMGFVVELTFLSGRGRLSGHDVFSLLQYDK